MLFYVPLGGDDDNGLQQSLAEGCPSLQQGLSLPAGAHCRKREGPAL